MDLFALILLAALIGVPLIVISLYNGIVGNITASNAPGPMC